MRHSPYDQPIDRVNPTSHKASRDGARREDLLQCPDRSLRSPAGRLDLSRGRAEGGDDRTRTDAPCLCGKLARNSIAAWFARMGRRARRIGGGPQPHAPHGKLHHINATHCSQFGPAAVAPKRLGAHATCPHRMRCPSSCPPRPPCVLNVCATASKW